MKERTIALAKLSIDLIANTSVLEKDFDRSGRAAEILATRVARATGTFIGFGGIAATASAGALLWVDRMAKATAELQGLADQAQTSAAAVASFTTASDLSGVSLERVAKFTAQLNTTLSRPVSDRSGAGEAIRKLGLDVEQLRALKPDEAIEAVAKALDGFAVGAGRGAAASAILGRGAAEALPFLIELAATGRSQIKLTDAQVAAADRYSKAQARTRSELSQLAQVAALEALPALSSFIGALTDTAEAIVGVDGSSRTLKSSGAVADFATGAVTSLGFVVDAADGVGRAFEIAGRYIGGAAAQVSALKSGEFAQAKRIGEELGADVEAILQRQLFSQRLAARLAAGQVPAKPEATKPALAFTLPDRTGNRAADASAREAEQVRQAQRDAALKVLDADLQKERAAYEFNNRFLQNVYAASAIGLDEFYATRRAAADRDAQAEADAFQKRIAALKAYRDATQDPSNRIKAATAVSDAEAQADRAAVERSRQAQLALQEEAAARKRLTESVSEYRAQLLQLEGDEAGAARLRTDAAIARARDFSTQSGGRVSASDVDSEYRARRAADALADAQRQASNASAEARASEYLALLQSEQAGESLLATERRVTAARTAALAVLVRTAQVAREVSDAAPGDEAKRLAATNAWLEYATAVDQADASLNRLREASRSAAEGISASIGDAVVNFQGLGSVIDSVEKQLLNIGTKVLFTDPLTKGLEGVFRSVTEGDNPVGNLLKGALGIGGGATAAGGQAAQAAATTANVAATTASTAALTALATAAATASASLGATGAASSFGSAAGAASEGGFIDSIGSLFSGFFAEGGHIPAGRWGVVGEKGPELEFGGRTGKTIVPIRPMNALGGGNGDGYRGGDRIVQQTNNFNVQGQVDRRTQSQIASTVYASAYRAYLRQN